MSDERLRALEREARDDPAAAATLFRARVRLGWTPFVVRRTSVWDDSVPPTDGAVRLACLRVDARTFQTPEEHDARCGGPQHAWFARGCNHRLGPHGIERDLDVEAWFVAVRDLAHLLELARPCRVVLTTESGTTLDGARCGQLEVYDDYRE